MPDAPVRVQIRGPGALLAVVPHLLGFRPDHSLVVVGLGGAHGRVRAAFRYDLPGPPGRPAAGDLAGHAAAVLHANQLHAAAVIGYGPGTLVTPLADVIRHVLPRAGIRVHDILRVDDGRYWSYLCGDPACCPPGGTPVPGTGHPVSRALAGAGVTAAESREAVAATIAPVTGAGADVMTAATRHAETARAGELASLGPRTVRIRDRELVAAAISAARDSTGVTDPAGLARVALALTDLEVRDDAWARMRPEHAAAHQRLWASLTRHARPGYVAAPASLLAFTSWQAGDGALANLALDRALADNPAYSMAHLLRDALSAGMPPSAAVLHITPEEVAASYDERRHS